MQRETIMAYAIRAPYERQRQDSVTDQLNDVLLLATRIGAYDAADFIKAKWDIK